MNIPEDRQLRVLNEHAELKEKYHKLMVFLRRIDDENIPEAEYAVMHEQLDAMGMYLAVLEKRIKAFL